MSYEIVYDRQFIKVRDKFIPMLLSGSNNCYEQGRGARDRRARSWFPMGTDNTKLPTREELMAQADEFNKNNYGRFGSDDDYHEGRFFSYLGWQIGNRSTFNQYKSWLKTSMDKAITLQQLKEINGSIRLIAQHGYNDTSTVNGLEPISLTTFDEDELLNTYENAKGKYKYITFRFDGWNEDIGKRARNKFFKRARKNEKKELKMVDHYYTIAIPGMGYLFKNTSRGFRYVQYPYKEYATKAEAQAIVNRYNKKYSSRHYEVERVDEKTQIYI